MTAAAHPAEATASDRVLRMRWLGRVGYRDAWALQRALFRESTDDHLLLLEHDPVYTLGLSADPSNVLDEARSSGAEILRVNRGGDVTFHGPGQLVGYPILTIPGKRGGGMADTAAYVGGVEQLVIDTLAELGLLGAGRLPGHAGVWIDADGEEPRKIAAIGVRLSRGRSMHGFALNVSTDLGWFAKIVPCGIDDKGVTSLAAEGVDVEMRTVVDTLCALAATRWGAGSVERSDVVWRHRPADLSAFSRGQGPGRVGPQLATPEPESAERPAQTQGTSVRLLGRLAEAGVAAGMALTTRKPEYLRVKAEMGPDYRRLKRVVRDLDLVTVCEEAGCPNIFECWSDGTATFMILGERCTRACGFCLVDTRKPMRPDPDEPRRVADAVTRMGLEHAVITMVARDDLPDGGASAVAATVAAIRTSCPGVRTEVLISDCQGDDRALATIFDGKPDVLNHNIETVARLQRAVRPSAGYARSLAVLARAKESGLTTKSSIMVGLGESRDEVVSTLADLAAIGVDIVTIGQYLRPTSNHLPVARWWEPREFDHLKAAGQALGISHVEASPLTRSSYHAKAAANAADAQVAFAQRPSQSPKTSVSPDLP